MQIPVLAIGLHQLVLEGAGAQRCAKYEGVLRGIAGIQHLDDFDAVSRAGAGKVAQAAGSADENPRGAAAAKRGAIQHQHIAQAGRAAWFNTASTRSCPPFEV